MGNLWCSIQKENQKDPQISLAKICKMDPSMIPWIVNKWLAQIIFWFKICASQGPPKSSFMMKYNLL